MGLVRAIFRYGRFSAAGLGLSCVVIGRSVATVAEVSFAAQWAMVLSLLGGMAGVDEASTAAWVIVPLIVVAQCCSWYGVVTTNYLANAIENSIWAVAFLAVGISLCWLLPEFEGVARLMLVVAIAGIAAYLAFLTLVDVPMYLSRWQGGLAGGGYARLIVPGELYGQARRVLAGHIEDRSLSVGKSILGLSESESPAQEQV